MMMLNHEKCAPSLKDLLPFLVDTGLRISEAIGLKWEHIDFNKGTVFVSDGKTKNARRHIPMTERVYQILIRLKESEEVYVFASRSRHSVSEQFRTLRDEMKLPSDCCIDSCRHTFLTRLGASGCDVFTLMRLAGHASVTISQRNVHPDAKNMEDAIARLEPKVAATPYA
jgi:integrase/recombinase XerD